MAFAILGLILGASYALLMGPLSVPDEGGHMYRAWLVSKGTFKGTPAVGDPAVYRVLYHPEYRNLDRRVTCLRLPPNSTGSDLLKLRDDDHGSPLRVIALFYYGNLYTCLPYLPAGISMRAGRVFTGSPRTLMYLGRLYLCMILFAMRLLPEFQLLLATLALMPMAMHQAASLSADSVTIALAFVITAFLLKLALALPSAPLKTSDYLLLLIGVIVAGLCKSLAGLVFLVLFISSPAANRVQCRIW